MRVIVCGCRDWSDREAVHRELTELFESRTGEMIVKHGCCPTGADAYVDRWAAAQGVKCFYYPADWNKHGRTAGPIRNADMAASGADLCLAFWDGNSKGTQNMILRAVLAGIPVRIVPSQPSAGRGVET